jgi:hypothetical protein
VTGEGPGFTPATVLRTMSLRRRVLHVLAGTGGGAGAALLTLLWATEPGPLPWRTRAAFTALIVVGLSWVVFAVWSLRRMPLFAQDRVVAGWLATGFSGVTALVAVVVAVARPGPVPVTVAAAAFGGVAAAVTILFNARKTRAQLRKRLIMTPGPPD